MVWIQTLLSVVACAIGLQAIGLQEDIPPQSGAHEQQGEEPKPLSLKEIVALFEKETTITLEGSGVTISSCYFEHEKKQVEAISFRPRGEGPFPGVFLIPGYSRSARDYIPVGLTLARAGFGALAVAQPGFGHSEGEPDWVGPATISALRAGYDRFCKEEWIDAGRTAVFGYSRGAVAAAILAVRVDRFKAAVCAAGIYDLKQEYATNPNPGIRANMEKETGLSDEAFGERSPLFMMEKLCCPLLILHGEKDVNASVAQARLLCRRLDALEKDYEVKLYPERDHDLGRKNLYGALLDFLERRLKSPEFEKESTQNPPKK